MIWLIYNLQVQRTCLQRMTSTHLLTHLRTSSILLFKKIKIKDIKLIPNNHSIRIHQIISTSQVTWIFKINLSLSKLLKVSKLISLMKYIKIRNILLIGLSIIAKIKFKWIMNILVRKFLKIKFWDLIWEF
jgi:hypothetical protein